MTLAEKVYAIIGYEAASGHSMPIECVWKVPVRPHAKGSENYGDWAFAFGVACGIARGEDPFESMESVIERAEPAARDAFLRYSGVDVLADAVA
jgi:hypothetical protein